MPITEEILIEIRDNIFTDSILGIGEGASSEELIRLIEVIPSNRYIKTLFLTESNINDEVAILLSKLENIEAIFASCTGISDRGVRELLKSRSLKALDITQNFLTGEALRDIGQNLILENLSMGVNQIGVKGAEYLSLNRAIKTLDLRANSLEDSCAKYLASMKSLKSLNLRGNRIGNIGYGILYDSAIEEVDLIQNSHNLYPEFLYHDRDSPGLRQRPISPEPPAPLLYAFRRPEGSSEEECVKAQMEIEEQQIELEDEILREEADRRFFSHYH